MLSWPGEPVMEGPLKIAEQKTKVRVKMPARRRSDAALAGGVEAFARHAGLAEQELSPLVREAVSGLLAEIQRLRAELEKAKARSAHLERLADEDALMPVANRRAFMRELSRLVALAKRYDSESSIVYIDLNGMKAINDRYGHNGGDAALQHVARILVENTRHADVVARLGGDEFGVLLVKTDQHNAEEKAARLARAIEQHPLMWEGTPIHLSAAFGAHCFNGRESVAEAIAAADRAMYRAKQAYNSQAG
jgi:diguanylate cyclase (GGDEF)-like protein